MRSRAWSRAGLALGIATFACSGSSSDPGGALPGPSATPEAGAVPTDASADPDAGVNADAGCASCGPLEQCWAGQLCVAKQVALPAGFAIDATEVTRSQYAAWLATGPSTAAQPASCASWNQTLQPLPTCMMNTSPACQGAGCGQHPQVCVDWCDAHAYCAAVGKRLCGKIGGGANAYADSAKASLSQWYNACTAGGTSGYSYPYGVTYDPQACNGADKAVGTSVAVGTLSACQSSVSGYSGVYDLSGNAWEWEDSCDEETGATDRCWVRGGSYEAAKSYAACHNQYYFVTRDIRLGGLGHGVGFRCCSR